MGPFETRKAGPKLACPGCPDEWLGGSSGPMTFPPSPSSPIEGALATDLPVDRPKAPTPRANPSLTSLKRESSWIQFLQGTTSTRKNSRHYHTTIDTSTGALGVIPSQNPDPHRTPFSAPTRRSRTSAAARTFGPQRRWPRSARRVLR